MLTGGILVAMYRREMPGPAALLSALAGEDRPLRIAVLEGLVNPANVGAIIRNAAALSMDAVLVTRDCADPLYRRAIRVGMGCVFQVPWDYIPVLAEGGIGILKQFGFHTAAMALSGDSIPIDDPVLKSYDRLALVFGAEGDGLKPSTIASCDHIVKIPMHAGVDSLNVAAASAVAFWELC